MATDIKIDNITNGSITNNEWSGSGVFDRLMNAVNKNIEVQHSAGRITGSDYAATYLGAMQSVIGQSIQYALQEKQIEAQIDLTRAQEASEKYNLAEILPLQKADIAQTTESRASDTAIKEAQSVEDLANKKAQRSLIEVQEILEEKKILDVVSSTAIKEAQSEKDLELKSAQKLDVEKTTEIRERDMVVKKDQSDQDLANKQAQLSVTEAQEKLVIAQVSTEGNRSLDLVATTALREQQKSTEVQNTSKVAYEVGTLMPKQANLLDADIDTKAANTALIDEKTATQKEATLAQAKTALKVGYEAAMMEDNAYISENTRQDKINKSGIDLYVAEGSKQAKIDLAKQQAVKAAAEADYVYEQQTQLVASVEYNNKIKVFDTMGDTYGTFGAGGLTVNAKMWQTWFDLAGDIANAGVPTFTDTEGDQYTISSVS